MTFIRSLHQRGPSLVIETMGKHGAVCSKCGFDPIFEPARKIAIVDTIGAVATFIGTFLGEYVQGQDAAECMKKATDAAAVSCMRFGGFDGCEII